MPTGRRKRTLVSVSGAAAFGPWFPDGVCKRSAYESPVAPLTCRITDDVTPPLHFGPSCHRGSRRQRGPLRGSDRASSIRTVRVFRYGEPIESRRVPIKASAFRVEVSECLRDPAIPVTLSTDTGRGGVGADVAVRGDRMGKSLRGCLLLILCIALVGCGAGSTSIPLGAQSAPLSTSSQTAAPTSSPPKRTQAQDTTDLKKALVTSRDLGVP